jgi:hypothetical protein
VSEANSELVNSEPIVPDGFDSWKSYWVAQGMSWRTEPEIGEERQKYLTKRRAIWADHKVV